MNLDFSLRQKKYTDDKNTFAEQHVKYNYEMTSKC